MDLKFQKSFRSLERVIIDQSLCYRLSPTFLSALSMISFMPILIIITLSEEQYGFRKKHSTELAAVKLVI